MNFCFLLLLPEVEMLLLHQYEAVFVFHISRGGGRVVLLQDAFVDVDEMTGGEHPFSGGVFEQSVILDDLNLEFGTVRYSHTRPSIFARCSFLITEPHLL